MQESTQETSLDTTLPVPEHVTVQDPIIRQADVLVEYSVE